MLHIDLKEMSIPVIVPDVMRGELEIPFAFPGVGI
jgi:hypothetical protein